MRRKNQVKESKEMILKSFNKLLTEFKFNDITLTEIADHAGLTRMTLHRHFKSKESILLYGLQNSMDKATELLSDKDYSLEDLLLLRLEQAQKLPHLAILIESKIIVEILHSFRATAYNEILEKFIGCKHDEEPFLFNFLFGGINNIFLEWLKNGCKESPREIAEKITYLLSKFKK